MGGIRTWLLAVAALALGGCYDATIGDSGLGADGGDRGKSDEVGGPDAGSGAPDASPGPVPDGGAPAPPDAAPSPEPIRLTHSASRAITPDISLSCNIGDADGDGVDEDFHAENRYLRTFDLDEFDVEDPLQVTSVEIGIESALARGGAGGEQPATVRLHRLTGQLQFDNLELLAEVDIAIEDQREPGIREVPIEATLTGDDVLAVEVVTPNGLVRDDAGNVIDGHKLFLGANSAGQSAPSLLAAGACGIGQPTDVATLETDDDDVAEVHYVIEVNGVHGGALP